MTQVNRTSGGKLTLRENVRRRDLKEEELRQHCWDQLHHPKIRRFRQKRYVGCEPWRAETETFVKQTEHPEPNYLDWVRGTYTACIPISDDSIDPAPRQSEVIVPLTLRLDFTRESEHILHWTIDIRASQIHASAAYPGIHRGRFTIMSLGASNSFCSVIWDTPIFSPYIAIESKRRGIEREDFKPISMKFSYNRSADIARDAYLEQVSLGHRPYGCYVNVLQRVLRDIARLLVFGPLYEDMKVAPRFTYEDQFKNPGVETKRMSDFFKRRNFPDAARFFSRVYCQGGLGENEADEDPVPLERCEASLQTIEALFEHFNIVREPPWLKPESDDWVDDMEAQARALKTMADWRNFEMKWSSVASYACGMNLHEGPWAGKNWQMYVHA